MKNEITVTFNIELKYIKSKMTIRYLKLNKKLNDLEKKPLTHK